MSDRYPHPAAESLDRVLAACRETRTRRSGPGGQHRNKVETAVVLLHEPTGVTAQAAERRSQNENRQVAIFRLRVNLALQVRLEPDRSASPSSLWRARCVNRRILVSPAHHDFPALLAEALDRLAANGFDIPPAAEQLGCTSTQLLRLLRLEPRAVAQLNREREARRLPRLR